MKSKFTRETMIYPSFCDYSGSVSVPAVFNLFVDTATQHSEEIETGVPKLLREGKIWVASKTRIRILKKAQISEMVEVSTWPNYCKGFKCTRQYQMTRNGETIAYGKSDWAVINIETGRLCNLKEIFSPEFKFLETTIFDEPFEAVDRDFSGCELLGEHQVRSFDIDMARHMNNVAYVRAMLGCMKSEECGFCDVEVHYLAQTREGATIKFYRRDVGNGIEIGGFADGSASPAVTFRIAK